MFSVITNLVTASGSPATLQQDRFAERMHAVFEDRTNMAIELITAKRKLVPGDSGAIVTLLGRIATARAPKAIGDMPVAGESDEYNYVVTPDQREYMDQHFDWDMLAESRFPAMAERGAQEVIRAKADRQRRFVHKLWATAKLAAIPNFDPAPGLSPLADASYTAIEVPLSLDDTGSELLFKSMVQLETSMMNRDVTLAPNWLWFMRYSAFNPLHFGDRTSSADFNSGADMRFGITPYIHDKPIILIPDMYWPSLTVSYTDPSFSHYNTDGTIAGANGTPVAFLVNYGGDISPIVEVEAAGAGGIVVEALSEPYRRIDTVRVTSRYSFKSHRRFAIGAISVRDT